MMKTCIAALAPVVSSVTSARLGEGGNGGPLAAPSGLTGSVDGNTVTLAWTDASDNEDGFRIYRAYKPKGKAQADFSLVVTIPANASGHVETVEVTVGGSRGRK